VSEPKLSDLDRCLHGRHAYDPCLSCPGGWSMGNGYLADGQRIGTDLYGKPILVGRVKGPQRRPEPPPTITCSDTQPHMSHPWARGFCPGAACEGAATG